MRNSHFLLAIITATLTISCRAKPGPADEYYITPVRLPDGAAIQVESMRTPQEMMRGMMFRDELPPDHGMLFTHGSPGKYTYWMYQVKLPLDIVWLDAHRRIVEISANTPPCPAGPASQCPKFGGNAEALYVVELASGMAAKHGLKPGDVLVF